MREADKFLFNKAYQSFPPGLDAAVTTAARITD